MDLKHFLTRRGQVAGLITITALHASPALAETLAADDFSEADGTTLNGKASDVGGTWTAPGDLLIQGGAIDTADVGAHAGSFLPFVRPLAAGETLYLGFETVETDLDFNSAGYAGISLFVGGTEQIFVGDPGGGGEPLFWSVTGPFNANVINASDRAGEAVDGVFTYDFDTGEYALYLDGVLEASGFGTSALALDQLRIQGNSEDGGAMAVSSFVATTDVLAVPEPASMALIGVGGLAMGMRPRRPLD